jgi:hypothetical protein
MVVQYPHTLKFDIATGGSEEIDENGDTIIVPGATATIEVKCRLEPNGSGEYLTSNDGLRVEYGWTAYMSLNQVEVPEGTQIRGYLGDNMMAYGTVKRFSKGQLNARAWV